MLAKEIKIGNIKKQREYIERGLSQHASLSRDGDTSYIYMGHIFPENIEYFKDCGMVITTIKNEMLTAIAKGRPVHLFTVSDDVVLTEEEIGKAEEWKNDPMTFEEFKESPIGSLIDLLINAGSGDSDEDESNEDNLVNDSNE